MSGPDVNGDAPRVSRGWKTASVFWALGVVAVVIFLFAAIAAPKFMVFSCKARQSEAKTNLSGLFTSERAFFGEYGHYTTDLLAIDWYPEGSPTYVYGFAVPSEASSEVVVADHDPTRRTTADARVSVGRYATTNMKTGDGRPITEEDLRRLAPDAMATSSAFLAVAIGDIDPDGREERFDIWVIDHERELRSLNDDCRD